ncbi:MAG TPA: MinD/ParA family protein [Microbacterium sp.]|uniref:MinD/ParA family ATP-binding protein n=1 Tax=Microbacterium sp. TaxID=51671 RepID=UPI002C3AABAB|nr:MinD/ParA family protein [Microbacterium sp.]HWI30470.1 MinD/ParA family protein [Microbacterium sp.]
MTPERNNPNPIDDEENGVLAETGGIETTGIGILGGATSHVDVSLPQNDDEDDVDDEVVDDAYVPEEDASEDEAEAEALEAEAEFDAEPAQQHAPERDEDIHTADIVIEIPVDAPWPGEAAAETEAARTEDAETDAPETAAAETAETETETENADAAAADVDIEAVAPEVPGGRDSVVPEEAAMEDDRERPDVDDAPARAALVEHPRQELKRAAARPEMTLASKRLDDLSAASRETADLLTADRLLEHQQVVQSEPEGLWRHLVYSLSGRRINLGDNKHARDRKELSRRIAGQIQGGARFVPVLSRKGGVGKTTITALLGMALADARDDRIIAVDANPDRGTLADRIARPSGKTVRDLVRASSQIAGYNDISNIVARDETRLDVLASDTDPHVSEAFSDVDYREVAHVAAHYYSIVLTDTGTGIVHSVMGATLDLADQLVVVAGLSIDEARLASETLTWLEANGYSEQVRNAVVVLNQASPGAPVVRLDEVETHFRSRVRDVVRMPYDPLIATGSAITFRDLQPATRLAARELAAKVVEGLRAVPAAA